MTKTLSVNQVDLTAFSIPTPANFHTITSIQITNDGSSIYLHTNDFIPQTAKFTIKYTATGTNDLNGIN